MSLFFEGPAIRRPKVRRLLLADFRSYETLDLKVEGDLIVLVGENGAGKTNILEAISLLTPGRGLRRADLADCAREGGGGGWAVSVELEDEDHRVQLGSGRDNADSSQPQSRKCRIDRAPVGSARAFADHVRVVWLTPSMDGLFTGPAGDRRRFLDRLVLAVDAEHGPRVTALERALRNRNRLLEDRFADSVWLDAAEREIAGIAVAVAAARSETVSRLAALITEGRDANSPFPWADLALAGELESMIPDMPALEVEDRYRAMLRASRARDAAAGRTLVGPQASDLVVRHGPKNADAARSSTGEQKALLVGLVLAHARLVASMSGLVPLVLLDEIAAHFDPLRRGALYDSLADLGAQVWMTGADPSAFADLRERATILRVLPGQVSAL
ncbi:MAG: recF [Hyphomicrobiales bacterium]|jgi:DNA replication and repair protein RecF|nr:recF [Hyphomicrobiales bacterium]